MACISKGTPITLKHFKLMAKADVSPVSLEIYLFHLAFLITISQVTELCGKAKTQEFFFDEEDYLRRNERRRAAVSHHATPGRRSASSSRRTSDPDIPSN